MKLDDFRCVNCRNYEEYPLSDKGYCPLREKEMNARSFCSDFEPFKTLLCT